MTDWCAQIDSDAPRVNTDNVKMILSIHCENCNNSVQVYNIFVPLKLCKYHIS